MIYSNNKIHKIFKKIQTFISGDSFGLLLSLNENKEQIIRDFKELILKMDVNSPDEINNKLADITKRVRKLYTTGRDQ